MDKVVQSTSFSLSEFQDFPDFFVRGLFLYCALEAVLKFKSILQLDDKYVLC